MSPEEAIYQWYIWASKELNWNPTIIDSLELAQFFDIVVLYDKLNNPEDYIPAEYIFRP